MKNLLKVVLLPIVLLTMISLTPSAWAEPENNPPMAKYCPHTNASSLSTIGQRCDFSIIPENTNILILEGQTAEIEVFIQGNISYYPERLRSSNTNYPIPMRYSRGYNIHSWYCPNCGEKSTNYDLHQDAEIKILSAEEGITIQNLTALENIYPGDLQSEYSCKIRYNDRGSYTVVIQAKCLDTQTDGEGACCNFSTQCTININVIPDSDCDGISDDDEINIYFTNPFSSDTNGDGLSDYDEIYVYGTDPLNSDTDDDGLSDYDEISTYFTDPLKPDTDDDGLSDYDEIYVHGTDPFNPDTDGDGISDGDEVLWGMNPLAIALQGNGYKYQEIIHDDAEGGNVEKWIVPASVSFNNIIDPENSNNRVFSCSGNLAEGVVFNFSELTNPSFKLSWRMKANGSFKIEVGCQTTNGLVRFIFTEADTDALEQETGVYYIGLGHATANNIWFTVICDLQRELWKIDPNNKISQIDYFVFSGNVLLDDLKSLMYVDTDRDCIPDSLEISLGLNPNDHLDAKLDMDGDGLTNVEEFMNKTAINNPDTDGDGVIDYDELMVFGSNPNSVDTDNDGLDDLWELTISGNMILTPDGDRNNDGITNFEECNLKLQINKTQELNGNIHLLIY